jgi:hypothetical protein
MQCFSCSHTRQCHRTACSYTHTPCTACDTSTQEHDCACSTQMLPCTVIHARTLQCAAHSAEPYRTNRALQSNCLLPTTHLNQPLLQVRAVVGHPDPARCIRACTLTRAAWAGTTGGVGPALGEARHTRCYGFRAMILLHCCASAAEATPANMLTQSRHALAATPAAQTTTSPRSFQNNETAARKLLV